MNLMPPAIQIVLGIALLIAGLPVLIYLLERQSSKHRSIFMPVFASSVAVVIGGAFLVGALLPASAAIH
jgi:hypothetical protein